MKIDSYKCSGCGLWMQSDGKVYRCNNEECSEFEKVKTKEECEAANEQGDD